MISEKMFIPIAFGNFCIFVTYSLPVAFFPDLAKSKGLGEGLIGLIFSFFPIGGFITSFLVGSYGAFVKRSKLILTFSILQTVALIVFALLEKIDDKNYFLGVAIVSRTVQGFSFGGLSTIIFGYVPTYYPDDIQRKVSFLEFICGISITIGVNIGQWLNNFGGYQLPFYVISALSFTTFLIVLIFLPDGCIPHEEHQPLKKRIIFTNPTFILVISILIVTATTYAFITTTLSLHLNSFPNGKDYLGFSFLLLTVTFATTNLFFALLKISIKRRYLMLFGLLSQALCLEFIPPEPIIFRSDSIWIMMIGLAMLGCFSNLCYQPTMTEMVDIGVTLSEQDPLLINDFVSGVYICGNLFSEAIGPLIGGYLFEFFGIRIVCISFFVTFIFIFFLYLIFGKDFSVTERKKSKMAVKLLETSEISHSVNS